MFILRAIGRFFVRIWRWIKETAWVQPLLIVGGIFAIIFSIPYLTKWVKSWFNDTSASEKYYSSKKVSLKNAKDHKSDVDVLFDYLTTYADEGKVDPAGEKKFGKKFFLTLVQENCANCDERYGAFKTLEENWGKGSFEELKGETFKMHTIYVDTKNDDGDNLFESVYDRDNVTNMFEDTISYMLGEYVDHPYKDNTDDSSFTTNVKNLADRENISTPTTFLIDLSESDKKPEWTSKYGVREVLFSFNGTNGSDDIAKARTLRDSWTNVERSDNPFSATYKK